MRLLEWNSWYREDVNNIVRYLKQVDADIVCLQEVTAGEISGQVIHEAEHIAKSLHNHFYFKEAQSWGKPNLHYGLGNAIFSKRPIREQAFLYLQEPKINPSEPHHEGRVYVEVTLACEGTHLSVGNTHLSFFGPGLDVPIKRQEFDKLYNHIKNKKEKYILAVDFNLTPDAPEIVDLSGLLNHAGPDFSQNNWTNKPFKQDNFEANSLIRRLDYVFATPDIKILSSKILPTEYSDHLPILVEFELV